jgi:1D-myo-inositol 3-kinase
VAADPTARAHEPLPDDRARPDVADASPAPTGLAPDATIERPEWDAERYPLGVDYLVVGQVSLDVFGTRYVLGGSATYAALTANRLGQRVGVLTSADFEPTLLETLIGRDGFLAPATDVRVARVPSQHGTTTFVNHYEGDARRQEVRAVAEVIRAAQLLPEWRSAPLVHLAPLALDVALDFVHAFPNAMLGVTPQGWMRAWDESGQVRAIPWEHAEPVLERADAIVLSEEDLADRGVLPRYAERAKLLVVTEARRGAYFYERGTGPFRSRAFVPARETDPTGAGDVFAAAFFTEYRRTGDAQASADLANCVASFSLEKRAWQGIPTEAMVRERLVRGKRRGG